MTRKSGGGKRIGNGWEALLAQKEGEDGEADSSGGVGGGIGMQSGAGGMAFVRDLVWPQHVFGSRDPCETMVCWPVAGDTADQRVEIAGGNGAESLEERSREGVRVCTFNTKGWSPGSVSDVRDLMMPRRAVATVVDGAKATADEQRLPLASTLVHVACVQDTGITALKKGASGCLRAEDDERWRVQRAETRLRNCLRDPAQLLMMCEKGMRGTNSPPPLLVFHSTDTDVGGGAAVIVGPTLRPWISAVKRGHRWCAVLFRLPKSSVARRRDPPFCVSRSTEGEDADASTWRAQRPRLKSLVIASVYVRHGSRLVGQAEARREAVQATVDELGNALMEWKLDDCALREDAAVIVAGDLNDAKAQDRQCGSRAGQAVDAGEVVDAFRAVAQTRLIDVYETLVLEKHRRSEQTQQRANHAGGVLVSTEAVSGAHEINGEEVCYNPGRTWRRFGRGYEPKAGGRSDDGAGGSTATAAGCRERHDGGEAHESGSDDDTEDHAGPQRTASAHGAASARLDRILSSVGTRWRASGVQRLLPTDSDHAILCASFQTSEICARQAALRTDLTNGGRAVRPLEKEEMMARKALYHATGCVPRIPRARAKQPPPGDEHAAKRKKWSDSRRVFGDTLSRFMGEIEPVLLEARRAAPGHDDGAPVPVRSRGQLAVDSVADRLVSSLMLAAKEAWAPTWVEKKKSTGGVGTAAGCHGEARRPTNEGCVESVRDARRWRAVNTAEQWARAAFRKCRASVRAEEAQAERRLRSQADEMAISHGAERPATVEQHAVGVSAPCVGFAEQVVINSQVRQAVSQAKSELSEVSRRLVRLRRQRYRLFLGHAARHHAKLFFGMIRSRGNRKERAAGAFDTVTVPAMPGKTEASTVCGEPEVVEAVRRHFSALYAAPRRRVPQEDQVGEELDRLDSARVREIYGCCEEDVYAEDERTARDDELEGIGLQASRWDDNATSRVIQSLKRDKSPGDDGVVFEWFQDGREECPAFVSAMTELVRSCVRLRRAPSRAKLARLALVTKDCNAAANDLGNQRSVSMLGTIGKIVEKCVKEMSMDAIERAGRLHSRTSVSPGLEGSGVGTLTSALLDTVDTLVDLTGTAVVATFDIAKCFDRIRHETIAPALVALGVPTALAVLIREMHRDNLAYVEIPGYDCGACGAEGFPKGLFRVETGTRQGSVLGPLVCAAVLNGMVMRLDELRMPMEGARQNEDAARGQTGWESALHEAVPLSDEQPCSLRHRLLLDPQSAFVDDIAVAVATVEQAHRAAEIVGEFTDAVGLKVNEAKCEAMVVAPRHVYGVENAEGAQGVKRAVSAETRKTLMALGCAEERLSDVESFEKGLGKVRLGRWDIRVVRTLRHLGVFLDDDNSMCTQVETLTSKVTLRFARMAELGLNGQQWLVAYRAMVVPMLLFHGRTRPFPAREAAQLDRLVRQHIRRVCKVPRDIQLEAFHAVEGLAVERPSDVLQRAWLSHLRLRLCERSPWSVAAWQRFRFVAWKRAWAGYSELSNPVVAVRSWKPKRMSETMRASTAVSDRIIMALAKVGMGFLNTSVRRDWEADALHRTVGRLNEEEAGQVMRMGDVAWCLRDMVQPMVRARGACEAALQLEAASTDEAAGNAVRVTSWRMLSLEAAVKVNSAVVRSNARRGLQAWAKLPGKWYSKVAHRAIAKVLQVDLSPVVVIGEDDVVRSSKPSRLVDIHRIGWHVDDESGRLQSRPRGERLLAHRMAPEWAGLPSECAVIRLERGRNNDAHGLEADNGAGVLLMATDASFDLSGRMATAGVLVPRQQRMLVPEVFHNRAWGASRWSVRDGAVEGVMEIPFEVSSSYVGEVVAIVMALWAVARDCSVRIWTDNVAARDTVNELCKAVDEMGQMRRDGVVRLLQPMDERVALWSSRRVRRLLSRSCSPMALGLLCDVLLVREEFHAKTEVLHVKAHVTDRVRTREEEWNERADGIARGGLERLRGNMEGNNEYLAELAMRWDWCALLGSTPISGVCIRLGCDGRDRRVERADAGAANQVPVDRAGATAGLDLQDHNAKRLLKDVQRDRLWRAMSGHVHQGKVVRESGHEWVRSVTSKVEWNVRRFLVRLCCGRLPCAAVQKERKLRDSALCPECGDEDEDVDHMFACTASGVSGIERALGVLQAGFQEWLKDASQDGASAQVALWLVPFQVMRPSVLVSGMWPQAVLERFSESERVRLKKMASNVVKDMVTWYEMWAKRRFSVAADRV